MRKTVVLFPIILWIFVSNLNAQFSVFGQLKDSTDNAVAGATVMLLHPKDSVLTNYTVSNSEGKFAFKNIRKTNYVLSISHITYMPYQVAVTPQEGDKELNM